jgi:diguanylate cyclase (GGDEF)-like protein
MPENQSHQGKRPRPRSLRFTLALAVLAVGILTSLVAGGIVRHNIRENALRRATAAADAITLKIEDRLNAYAVLLRGAQGLFAASASVERDEWRRYVRLLQAWDIVPGYEGIGFAVLIPAAELDDHVAGVRREGFPAYQVTPSGTRDVYSSIVYLEPFAGRNLLAFGYDMFSDPVRRAAMEQARDTGRPALSGKVTLRQEGGRADPQPGTLMYVPVYRNDAPAGTVEERRAALLGWVYSPYRMRDLMTGILGGVTTRDGELLDLRIYDSDRADPRRLLFDSHPAGRPPVPASFLHVERTITFNGRLWLLVFDGDAAAAALSYWPAWLTGAAGLVISGLLFGMLLAIFNRADARRLAENYAAQIRDLAFYDSLTGLPNRRLLDDRLAMALAAGHREGAPGALCLLDLDNFKPLNDRHGHAAGDLLLAEVARRLQSCVRETDTVARLGGDEFVILLPALTGGRNEARRHARDIAETIRLALEQPFHLRPAAPAAPIEHRCPCSIGLTLFDPGETDPSAIIKRADDAMYQAKRDGRNRIAAPFL